MTLLYIAASSCITHSGMAAVKARIAVAAGSGPLAIVLDDQAVAGTVEGLGLAQARTFDLSNPDGITGLSPSLPTQLSLARCGLETAAIFAASLEAEFEVLAGPGGAFQCSRAIVAEARELESLSFEEAAELSHFRDTGIDPDLIGPLVRHRARARIRSFDEDQAGGFSAGTLVDAESDSPYGPVKALVRQEAVVMVSVSGACLPGMVGMAARVFASVSQAGVSVLLISQSSSEYAISFCILARDKPATLAAVEKEFATESRALQLDPIAVIDDLAILTLIGDGMRSNKGIAGKCLVQLARADINITMIAQGSSERSLSVVILHSAMERGMRMVYQAFFDSAMPIELCIIGCGNVGSALLQQLATQAERLESHNVSLRIVAISNSRRMVVDARGVDPAAWRDSLATQGQPFNLDTLMALGPDLMNPVLVDCTAGDAIPGAYPDFMLAGFHVITPNKRGNSGPMERYLALKRLAIRHRRRYLYETTVGAGLPVIENLQNLLHAGDQLESFSGILSGSLSFLFGRLDEGASFSEAVREAMGRGFTEPDPRDDLSGKDVARKVLILAREAGLTMELDDIQLDGLVPPDYLALGRDEFVARMHELDDKFGARQKAAAAEGKVLRFVGSIEAGKGRIGLQAVGPEHPLFTVKGGENALAFSTRYYSPVPLLLRGYGAGANVTAAGIFADILRTLNWNREE